MSRGASPFARGRYEVAVVGGGPVGLGLAIDLGLRGIECALVERRGEPQPIPKGQNLTQRTMEHFYEWGVEDEVRAARRLPRQFPIGGVTAYGTLSSDYAYDWYRRDAVSAYFFRENERLPQYETERALRRRLDTLDTVDSGFGWTATNVTQSADGAQVRIVDGRRAAVTIEAGFVVGCDGSRSLVRDQVGITETVSDHRRRMILLVFTSRALHRLLDRYQDRSFFSVLTPELEGYWRFLGRVDASESWFFHAPVPAHSTPEDDFTHLLEETVGAPFDYSLDYAGIWDLRTAIADTYRQGRVLLAGDAAHSHPPYGGFGVNTGLEDARNLGWKLAASLRGWAGPALLDSYEAERLPVFRSTARDFIQAFIDRDREFVRRYSPEIDRDAFEAAWTRRRSEAGADVHAYEPHHEGSPIVLGSGEGPPSARGSHEFAARAGHHLAPRRSVLGRSTFDDLSTDFTLIALDAPRTSVLGFQAEAEQLGIPLEVVTAKRSGELADYEASLILVRPDHYVAWSDRTGAAPPKAVLARATGQSVPEAV